jgi:hypothetical protein
VRDQGSAVSALQALREQLLSDDPAVGAAAGDELFRRGAFADLVPGFEKWANRRQAFEPAPGWPLHVFAIATLRLFEGGLDDLASRAATATAKIPLACAYGNAHAIRMAHAIATLASLPGDFPPDVRRRLAAGALTEDIDGTNAALRVFAFDDPRAARKAFLQVKALDPRMATRIQPALDTSFAAVLHHRIAGAPAAVTQDPEATLASVGCVAAAWAAGIPFAAAILHSPLPIVVGMVPIGAVLAALAIRAAARVDRGIRRAAFAGLALALVFLAAAIGPTVAPARREEATQAALAAIYTDTTENWLAATFGEDWAAKMDLADLRDAKAHDAAAKVALDVCALDLAAGNDCAVWIDAWHRAASHHDCDWTAALEERAHPLELETQRRLVGELDALCHSPPGATP